METKPHQVTPAGRRGIRLAALAAAALACAALAGWGVERRALVASGIPARPSPGSLPAGLDAALADAEDSARGLVRPVGGLVALSRLYHGNSLYNQALQCYGALRQLQPGEARWPHLEASILGQFGRLDEALPRERKAVELAPDYVPARLKLGDELLGSNRAPDAARTYTGVLERSPDNPYALLGLAKCDVASGDWSRARGHLLQAIEHHPDFIRGLSLLVTVAEHLGDQADANSLKNVVGERDSTDVPDPWLEGLMEDCFNPYRISVAAAVAETSGNHSAAIHLLERAIALDPSTSAFQRQVALIYSTEGDLPSARQHLERAVAVSPGDDDSWLELHKVLGKMGDAEAAERALATGLVDCPGSFSLHMERGHQLNSTGDRESAIAEFREAHRLHPAETEPLVELASALMATNQGSEALGSLQEALEKQPENPMALAALTFYYIDTGDEAAALQWWAHVRWQTRTPPRAVDALRKAYQQKFGRDLE
jgi:tetratricopeptide (TPR) repeat protein